MHTNIVQIRAKATCLFYGESSSISSSLGFWLGYCAKSHDAPLSSQPRNKGEGEGFRVLGLGGGETLHFELGAERV